MHISLTFFTNEQDFLIQQAELPLDWDPLTSCHTKLKKYIWNNNITFFLNNQIENKIKPKRDIKYQRSLIFLILLKNELICCKPQINRRRGKQSMMNIYYWFYSSQFSRSTSQIPKQSFSENKADLNDMHV